MKYVYLCEFKHSDGYWMLSLDLPAFSSKKKADRAAAKQEKRTGTKYSITKRIYK